MARKLRRDASTYRAARRNGCRSLKAVWGEAWYAPTHYIEIKPKLPRMLGRLQHMMMRG